MRWWCVVLICMLCLHMQKNLIWVWIKSFWVFELRWISLEWYRLMEWLSLGSSVVHIKRRGRVLNSTLLIQSWTTTQTLSFHSLFHLQDKSPLESVTLWNPSTKDLAAELLFWIWTNFRGKRPFFFPSHPLFSFSSMVTFQSFIKFISFKVLMCFMLVFGVWV